MVVLSLNLPVYGLEYINQGLVVSLKLPDGYENVTKGMPPTVLIGLRKLDATGKVAIRLVVLQDLETTLVQNELPARPEVGKFKFTIETAHWKSFDLSVVKIIEAAGTTFNVQIPFKPHAIQISLFGPAAAETQLRSELQAILDSADGQSNWLTDKEIHQSMQWALIRLVVGVVLLVGLIVFLVRRRRAVEVD